LGFDIIGFEIVAGLTCELNYIKVQKGLLL